MKKESTDARLTRISTATTQKLPEIMGREASQARKLGEPERGKLHAVKLLLISLLLFGCLAVAVYPLLIRPLMLGQSGSKKTARHHVIVKPFDPNVGAILPTHRIVAYYGIPNAEVTGPAYELNAAMLARLQAQGAAYQNIDPTHPVQLGIDLVVSVPDRFPGPDGHYSHHLDPATIQAYLTFCEKHNLMLFLDLDFGRTPVMQEVDFFLPYLERYPFVQMAIDPEWMFPRDNGIPGIDLSNVRASDLNPVIEALAALPMKYHVPRKILLIHQYRGDGDGLVDPYEPGQAEIADKRDLVNDPRVDVVIHVDGVGGYVGDQEAKSNEYHMWVAQDMEKYHNFRYGGFKLFYQIEAKTGLMTPQQVMALKPQPMVITYGN